MRSKITFGVVLLVLLAVAWLTGRAAIKSRPESRQPPPAKSQEPRSESEPGEQATALSDDNIRSQEASAPKNEPASLSPKRHGPTSARRSPPHSSVLDAEKAGPTCRVTIKTVEGKWRPGQFVRFKASADSEWTESLLGESGIALDLPLRNYEATCVASEKGAGELVHFTPTDGGTVSLSPPKSFALQLQVVDYLSGTPVPSVEVEVKSTIGHPDLSQTDSLFSDEFGYVTTTPIQSGAAVITIRKPKHETASFDLDLPGQWGDELEDSDTIDLGVTDIVRFTPFQLQLKSEANSKDFSGYRVSHTDRGNLVQSKANGRVEMQLGVFGKPLYLKVWYPDDHVSIRYLDGGMPAAGESHTILAHTQLQLEIALSCTEELRGILDSGEFTIAASFTADNRDAAKNTRDVNGPGVYAIHGVDSSAVTISLERMTGDVPTTWAIESALLPRSGLASVLMRVEAAPTILTLTDNDGTPIIGASVELREAPDQTGWTAGAVTNNLGEMKTPRTGSRGRLRVSWESPEDGACHAIGIPLDMSLPNQRRTIRFGQMIRPRVEVYSEAGPVRDYSLMLGSAYSAAPYIRLRSNDLGVVDGFSLTSDSAATATVSAEGIWFANDTRALAGKTVRIRGYQMGSIVLEENSEVSRIVAQEFDISLRAWADAGSISINEMPDGSLTAHVPVGTYLVKDRLGELARTIVVGAGQVHRIGAE